MTSILLFIDGILLVILSIGTIKREKHISNLKHVLDTQYAILEKKYKELNKLDRVIRLIANDITQDVMLNYFVLAEEEMREENERRRKESKN